MVYIGCLFQSDNFSNYSIEENYYYIKVGKDYLEDQLREQQFVYFFDKVVLIWNCKCSILL